jgi:hypothetical protein
MLLTAITAHLLLSIDFSKSGCRRYKAANSQNEGAEMGKQKNFGGRIEELKSFSA